AKDLYFIAKRAPRSRDNEKVFASIGCAAARRVLDGFRHVWRNTKMETRVAEDDRSGEKRWTAITLRRARDHSPGYPCGLQQRISFHQSGDRDRSWGRSDGAHYRRKTR